MFHELRKAEIGAIRQWPRFAILIAYVAVMLPVIVGHTMWADEMQAWLIARDSADLPALFHNLHYEGHGALWYLLLMPLTRLSHDPLLMQLMHAGIATATVALVLWRAPLCWPERVLFPFGYFFLYEYGIKSRGYGLGCLFVFLLCALWHRRRQSPVSIAIVLALLANVDILFMLLAIAALLALAVDRLINRPPAGDKPDAGWRSDLAALAIVGAGFAMALATVVPPPDSGIAVGWFLDWSWSRLDQSLAALTVVLTPADTIWARLAAAAIMAIIVVRCRANLVAAIFLVSSVAALLMFFFAKYPGAAWHHGLIFVALFATVWIDRSMRASLASAPRRHLLPTLAFAAILGVQAYVGVRTTWTDFRRPLSNGRNVAHFIAAQGWAADPIIGFPDFQTVPITGYLDIPQVYYPQGRRWGSFVIWDQRRLQPVNFDTDLADIDLARSAATWVAEIPRSDPDLIRKHGFTEVAKFTGAALENFVVYRRPAGAGR